MQNSQKNQDIYSKNSPPKATYNVNVKWTPQHIIVNKL